MIRRQEALETHERIASFRVPRLPGNGTADEARAALERIAYAETFWVSDEIAGLLSHAAKTMPDEPFLPLDVPSPSGLILFASPQTLREDVEKDSRNHSFDGLSWFGTENGCHIGMFNSSYKLAYLDSKFCPFGVRYKDLPERDLPDGKLGPPAAPFKPDPAALKNALREAARRGKAGWQEPFAISFMRLPKVFWLFIQETILRTEDYSDRAARRRLLRKGSNFSGSKVKLVMLRRAVYGKTDGHSEVNWSHRWMVSFHWRNQWHPRQKVHRLRPIAPYEKGPKDKPLVLKDTLNLVVR